MDKKEELRPAELNFEGKQMVWTGEFVNRVITRGIINIFNNDLDTCKKEIERLMREDSAVVHNPIEEYSSQKWVLIDLPVLGLTKLPVKEAGDSIVVITIANPVPDPRCKEAFKNRTRKG